jgi:glutamate synthase (NADPH/NADH) small chain
MVKGENGKVTQLVCNLMQLGEPDASGRRSPIESGEQFMLETDMIIKATGQMPFEELVSNGQLQHMHGKIATQKNGSTNIPRVFAGGDCVNGGKEVVDAVQAGKLGAGAILEYLVR